MPELTIDDLLGEAKLFAQYENEHYEPRLYGVNDGKAIGTYLEQKFTNGVAVNYTFEMGNAATGIDLPSLNVDLKTTSIRQPQSSCPFKSARQKVYGLGYHLLVFVYDKADDHEHRTSCLNIQHAVFVDQNRTADFQTTKGILEILRNEGILEDLVAFFTDRNLPLDEIAATNLAEEVIQHPPSEGYLTISNALQWRLQYGRVIAQAGQVAGVQRVFPTNA